MSELCLVAAMVAKMQAADHPVSIEPEPIALDRLSPQAKHHPYQPTAHRPSWGLFSSPAFAQTVEVSHSFAAAEFSPGRGMAEDESQCQTRAKVADSKLSKLAKGRVSTVARATATSQPLSRLSDPFYWQTTPNFSTSQPSANGPRSGPQLYYQRLAALKAGHLYTRLPADSFRTAWTHVTAHPDYNQWKSLLALEAKAVGGGQGSNRLSIVVGDSISQWLPMQDLSRAQLWMNQGISGDTTRGILQRLSAFKNTRPQSIYVMAGVNDLKNGYGDDEITANLRQIMRQLRQNHPKAEIFVQSILPTATPKIDNDRIRRINTQLAQISREEKVTYLDLHSQFTDAKGAMFADLTTDGIHLNPRGYGVWQSILRNMEYWVALNQNLGRQTPWSS